MDWVIFAVVVLACLLGPFVYLLLAPLHEPSVKTQFRELNDAVESLLRIPPPAWMIRFVDWLADVADRLPPRQR